MEEQRKTWPNVPTRSSQSKGVITVAVVAVVTPKILHLIIRYLSLKIYNLFLKFVAIIANTIGAFLQKTMHQNQCKVTALNIVGLILEARILANLSILSFVSNIKVKCVYLYLITLSAIWAVL